MIRVAGIGAIVLALLLGAGSAQALTLNKVGSFDDPTYVTSDPGNANRLLVTEREGTIQLVENGVVSQFADLTAAVNCAGECQGERGLMSIALAPDFTVSGRLYVDYANNADGVIHIAELVAESGHKTANPTSLKSVLEIPHPAAANHNGGQIQFGPDGNLYVSTGDGGGSNDEFHHAQDLGSALGKILRIYPQPSLPAGYTVPVDNPFAADPSPTTNLIWSYGLRNPFRFSFDWLNGDMVIGDVGQSAREEIDFAPSPTPLTAGGAGANYGWNCREGYLPGPATDPQCATFPPAGFVNPVFDYSHSPDPEAGRVDPRCAVIGGYVARDPALGGLNGNYVYSDLCSGVIRTLQLPATADGRAGGDCSLGITVDRPVSFGEDSARRLYVVAEGGGVFRLAGLPPATCPRPPQSPPPQAPIQTRVNAGPTFIGIKAERRRVERGKVALLTVAVSPCDGRKGQPVELLRNGHLNGSKLLSRACTARFLPRIRKGTVFTAFTREERNYLPGKSRQLTIRLAHRRQR